MCVYVCVHMVVFILKVTAEHETVAEDGWPLLKLLACMHTLTGTTAFLFALLEHIIFPCLF